jgi:hypothetical protein
MPGVGFKSLVLAGQNITAFAGINGPYLTDSDEDGSLDDETPKSDAIGFAITDLDFALVLGSPQIAGQQLDAVRMIGITLSSDYIGLVGTEPYLTLNAQDIVFQLNLALLDVFPLPGTFIDFSSVNDGGQPGMDIPIGRSRSLNLAELDANMLRIGMQGNIGLFDIINLQLPRFDFTFKLPDTGDLIPEINLNLGEILNNVVPTPSVNTPEWLKGAIKFLQDVDISIGVSGITGTIQIPDHFLRR